MILSDRSIKEAVASGRLGIDPFDPELVQPSSVDVRLDNKFLVFRNTKRAYIDVKQPADDLMEMIEVAAEEPMFLHPHEFVLGSTIERVRMPNDLVARLEGRSSLGRLGVVIHSSLPYDEPVLFLDRHGVLEQRPIGRIVENRIEGQVVAFDRDTFEVSFHEVTNWFRELPDKVYEVRLASGRSVRVTAGHNLFTLDAAGELRKTPTSALSRGTRVAIPKAIPGPGHAAPELQVLDILDKHLWQKLVCHGPTVDRVFEEHDSEVRALLRGAGLSVSYYARKRCLPLPVLKSVRAAAPGFCTQDRFTYRRSRCALPAVIHVNREFAWLLGLYVAEGYRRGKQVNVANTDRTILDRAERAFEALGQHVYRTTGSITCCSVLVAALFEGLGMGGGASTKRLPNGSLGWPCDLLEALLEGLLDGDGSRRQERDCLWTTSSELVSQVLLASGRFGRRAVTQTRAARPHCLPGHVVSIAKNRHRVLTATPNPRELLAETRRGTGLSQVAASRALGFRHATSLNNIEKRLPVLHIATLERLYETYVALPASRTDAVRRLGRVVDGGLQWDEVVHVVDTGRFEPVYDLEVRGSTGRVENFLAGSGGVFVSNTAGFIDPEFEGHVTLEISNLANLPIALYPGMRIGQISFSLMTTPAERPYGAARGSKYSGQQLPTASRLYLDFRRRD